MNGGARRLGLLLLAAMLGLAAFDAALFWSPLYRGFVAPDSSAGVLLATLQPLRARHFEGRRDVLVFGDSRIFRALDPAAAASGATSVADGGLRFWNAGVAGTTPRCWPSLAVAADPDPAGLAAVVVPVDTYADTSASLGALDANEHLFDLHFLAITSRATDVPGIVRSFPGPIRQAEAALGLLLRGPEFADDVQALLSDPFARVEALEHRRGEPDPTTSSHASTDSLAGLRLTDDGAGILGVPATVGAGERSEIAASVLATPLPEPGYAAYRQVWLGKLVARYRRAGVPVIIARIPTRPIALDSEWDDAPRPGSAIAQVIAETGAVALPAAPSVALERPELFSDHDHLDAAGATVFSWELGRAVASVLAGRPVPSEADRWEPAIADTAPAANSPARERKAVHPVRTARPRATPSKAESELTQAPATPLGHVRRFVKILETAAGFGAPIRIGTFEFFAFVLIVLAAFSLAPRTLGRVLLLVASYYFYARWNAKFVLILWALTLSDYAIAIALERMRARGDARVRALLALGIAANLAFLGTFKYADFFGATLGALAARDPLWVLHLAVPVGISFHTFQSISYLVDVARGVLPARRKLLDYALYLAFFPQLLAGPIVRAKTFLGELDAWRRPAPDEIARGLGEIARGTFEKFVVADNLAPAADAYFGNVAAHASAGSAWAGTLAFSLQIYFDFAGYSDIAIGLARLFGFAFPENFRRPYLALGARDFWRRWHMTLSSWLRDYLYIPLGGNRHGAARTIANLMTTMLLGGLWHGAGWTFVAWGAYHGAWLSIERLTAGKRERALTIVDRALAMVSVWLVVAFGWVLFRATSFGDAFATWTAMLGARRGTDAAPVTIVPWVLVAAACAFALEVAIERGAVRFPALSTLGRGRAALAVGCSLVVLVALQLLWAPQAQTFVYFKF